MERMGGSNEETSCADPPLLGELDPIELPVLYGSRMAKLHATIDWVHDRVRKTAWDTDRLRRSYMRRTPKEILHDQDTLALAPCPDRSLIAALVLRQNDVPFNVIVHENEGFIYEPASMHFAIEVEVEEETYWFDFFAQETRFLKGPYFFRSDVELETLQLIRLQGDGVNPFSLSLADVEALISPKKTDFSKLLDWICRAQRTFTSNMCHDRVVYSRTDSQYS